MQYSLIELLDQVQLDGAVALYLSEGFAPIFALPNKHYDPALPSALLFPVEGLALTREDLRSVLATLREMGYASTSLYEGIGEFRYSRGTSDLDVFVFISGESCRIEFRRPGVSG